MARARLKQIRAGRSREKRGAARTMIMRHRRQGESVASIDRSITTTERDGINTGFNDPRGYVDIEWDPHGQQVTDPATLPRP